VTELAPAPTASASTSARLGGGAMFDKIARRYDLLNRLMSLGLDRRWRRALVRALGRQPAGGAPGLLVDVATGTADVALALARAYPAARVVGVDPSGRMLSAGRRKLARSAGALGRAVLVQGDGQALPLPDGVADGVAISFGIRNVPDRLRGLREMARVARPGAPLAVLELGEPRVGPLSPVARWHVHTVVPRLGAWLSGAREYRYLAESIAAFPSPDAFTALCREAGWTDVRVRPFSFDAVHLYTGRAPGA
jgi:demethylmenaquinone methyltransferase/2-methoxy-6-polyprenyl-1,4-benzoquinol methylase